MIFYLLGAVTIMFSYIRKTTMNGTGCLCRPTELNHNAVLSNIMLLYNKIDAA